MVWCITGATGFLGRHVLDRLAEAGHSVRCLVRPGSLPPEFPRGRIEVVRTVLGGGALPPEFCRPGDILIHLAAIYTEEPGRQREMERVNLEGTRAVLAAAVAGCAARVVHVSTMGTCAPARHGRPATEADFVPTGLGISAYVRSKIAAERLALEEREVPVVIVNPAAPIGRHDHRPTVTGARVWDLVAGRWPRLPDGPVAYADARAVAGGILAAAELGRPGERYLLGGENLSGPEFVRRVSAAGGLARPREPLHSVWKRVRARWLGPRFSLAVDDTRAVSELGYQRGDLDDAMAQAVAERLAAER